MERGPVYVQVWGDQGFYLISCAILFQCAMLEKWNSAAFLLQETPPNKGVFSLAQTLFKHHFQDQEHQPRAKVVTLHLHAHFNHFALGCCILRTLSAGHSSTGVSLCWKNRVNRDVTAVWWGLTTKLRINRLNSSCKGFLPTKLLSRHGPLNFGKPPCSVKR